MKKILALLLLAATACERDAKKPAPVPEPPPIEVVIPQPPPRTCEEGSEWGLGPDACFRCENGRPVQVPCRQPSAKPRPTFPLPLVTQKPPCKEGAIKGVAVGGGLSCFECRSGVWRPASCPR